MEEAWKRLVIPLAAPQRLGQSTADNPQVSELEGERAVVLSSFWQLCR